MTWGFGRPRARTGLFALVLALLAVAGGATVRDGAGRHTAVAYFTQAKGLYAGDDVQVLGVRVGSVTKITPEPGRVRVEFAYDADRPLPADVKALIMAPSVVPVRALTLAPVYRSGPKLADGAEIPVSRTAVPVEWDDIKHQLDRLATALGPTGANTEGSLSRLLDVGAANLKGQGTDLNQTLRAMSEAMATLADGRGDLFATVRNLQVFVDALARSDRQVMEFNQRLAAASDILDDNGEELAVALVRLTKAFEDVTAFLQEHRSQLAGTVADLQPVAKVLADNRQQLADVLQVVSPVVSNFYNIYDPLTGSLNGVVSLANLQAPAVFICSTLVNLGGSFEDCQTALGPLAELLTLPVPPVGASPLERNGRSNTVQARPGPEPPAGSSEARPDLPGLMNPGGTR